MICNIDEVIKDNLDKAISKFVGNGKHFERKGNTLIGKPSPKFPMDRLYKLVEENKKRSQEWIDDKFNNNPKLTNWIHTTKHTDGFTIDFKIPPLLEQAWNMKIARLKEEEKRRDFNSIYFRQGNEYVFQGEVYPTYEDALNVKNAQEQDSDFSSYPPEIKKLIQTGEITYTNDEGKLLYRGKRYDSMKSLINDYNKNQELLALAEEFINTHKNKSIAVSPNTSFLDRQHSNIKLQLQEKINRLNELSKLPTVNKWEINKRIEDYKKIIRDLNKKSSTPLERSQKILEVAKEDLRVVEELLNRGTDFNPEKSNDLLHTTEIWSNVDKYLLEDLMDDDLVSQEVYELKSKAAKLDNKIMSEAKKWLLANADPRFKLVKNDLEVIEGDGYARSHFLDIKESKSRLAQFIGSTLQKATIKEKQNVNRRLKELEAVTKGLSEAELLSIYEADHKKKPKGNELIRETNRSYWDKVRQMQTYQEHLNKAQANLIALHKLAVKNGINSPEVAKEKINLLTKGYFEAEVLNHLLSDLTIDSVDATKKTVQFGSMRVKDWHKNNEVFLNPLAIMSPDKAERERLKQEFRDNVGLESYANSIINKAEYTIKKFKQDRNQYEEYLEYIEPDETKRKTMLTRWEFYNNPLYHYEYLISENLDPKLLPELAKISRYNFILFKAPKQGLGHYNDNYSKIVNNPKLRPYYEFMRSLGYEGDRILPDDVKTAGSNFLPAVRKNLAGIFKTNKNKGLQEISAKIMSGFTDFGGEEVKAIDAKGNPTHSILSSKMFSVDSELEMLEKKEAELSDPKYIKDLKDNIDMIPDKAVRDSIYEKNKGILDGSELKKVRDRIDELDYSYEANPIVSATVYINTLERFKTRNDIENEVIMSNAILKRAEESTEYGSKKGLEYTQRSTDYAIDFVLYNKKKEKGDSKKLTENIFELKDLVPGLTSEKKKKAKLLRDKILASRIEYEDIVQKETEGEDLTDYEKEAKTTFENLVKDYESLNGRKVNTSSIADTAIRITQAKMLGLSPVSAIHNSIFGFISNMIESYANQHFGKKEFAKANAIMGSTIKNWITFGKAPSSPNRDKIVNFMDVMGITAEMIESKYGGASISNLEEKLFMWLKSSDFHMKGTSIVAMLNKQKIDTGNEEVVIWDLLKTDGTLDKSKFTEEKWEEWENNKKVELVQYIQSALKRIHGNFDPDNAVLAKKNEVYRLLGQFKLSWLAQAIDVRFGDKVDSGILGVTTQGRYRATWSALMGAEGATLAEKFDSFWNTNDPDVKAEVRRTVAEILFLLGIAAVGIILRMLLANLDDDEDKAIVSSLRFILNLLYRSEQDLSLYFSPQEYVNLTRNTVAATSLFTDVNKALSKSYRAIFDEDYKGDVTKAWLKTIPVGRPLVQMQTYMEKDLEAFLNR